MYPVIAADVEFHYRQADALSSFGCCGARGVDCEPERERQTEEVQASDAFPTIIQRLPLTLRTPRNGGQCLRQ